MGRLLVALLIGAVVCLSASAKDDKAKPAAADPVAAELTRAKEEYQAAAKAASEKLVAAFASQQKKLEDNTKLKVADQIKQVERLKDERKAFEADPSKLPDSPSMKVAAGDYRTQTAAAKERCKAAFDRAAESYRGKKDLAAAKAVLDEKGQFFNAEGPLQPGTVWIATNPDGSRRATLTVLSRNEAMATVRYVAGNKIVAQGRVTATGIDWSLTDVTKIEEGKAFSGNGVLSDRPTKLTLRFLVPGSKPGSVTLVLDKR